MAKAPRPGVSRREEEVDVSKRVLAIKLAWDEDATYRIAVGNVPMDHRLAVRKQTGIPFDQFLGGPDAIGTDSIAVMVWLAKRLGGKPSLSWQQFCRSWPDSFGEGDIEVWGEDSQGHKVDDDGNPVDDETDPEAAADPES